MLALWILPTRTPETEAERPAPADDEKRLYAVAFRDFTLAFDEGYVNGKLDLAAGKVDKLQGLSERFCLDVPRCDVVADRWRGHVPRFRQCGRVAAIAESRRGEAKLKLTDTEPDLWRWTIDLAPDD